MRVSSGIRRFFSSFRAQAILFCVLITGISFAQNPDTVSVSDSEAPAPILLNNVQISFIKYKTFQSADSIYFNVLKLTNNTPARVSGIANIQVPSGWNLISDKTTSVSVGPGETAYVPVRLALLRTLKGGVAYVVSATYDYDLTKPLLSSTCYVTTPKVSKWRVFSPKRIVYLSKRTQYEKFKLVFENNGNYDELIKLDFKVGESLEMAGAEDGVLTMNFVMPANMDTTLFFDVKFLPKENGYDIHNWRGSDIRLTASTSDKKESYALWFKFLKSSHRNTVQGVTPLNLDVNVRNLLSIRSIGLGIAVYGTILFKKNRGLTYQLGSYSLLQFKNKTAKQYFDDQWRYGRILLTYSDEKFRLIFGDIVIGIESGAYGRGLKGSYKFGKNKITVGVARNLFFPLNAFSLEHQIDIGKSVSRVDYGLTYVNDDYNKINTAGGAAGLNFSFLKNHAIRLLLGYSNVNHNYDDSTFRIDDTTFVKTDDPGATFNGYGLILDYSGRILKKLRFNLSNRFGSKYHQSVYKGRHELTANVWYTLNERYSLTLRYGRHSYDPAIYRFGRLQPKSAFTRDEYLAILSAKITDKTSLQIGPHIDYQTTQRYSSIDDKINTLSSRSLRLNVRLNHRPNYTTLISPYVVMGFSEITDFPDSSNGIEYANISELTKPFYNFQAGLSFRKKHWGVNIFYYYGPYSIASQSAYVSTGLFHKSITILPYFEKYIKKNIRLVSYNSYTYDASRNTQRINLNLRVEFYLKKEWMLFMSNSLSLYSRISSEGGKISNRTYYLDVGFRKAFDMQQPRVKYYNLKVVCFEDINGNRSFDDNEKGIDNIIIQIDRHVDTSSINLGKFEFIEMITDQFGEINYYKIPEGTYKLEFTPLFKLGNLYNINGKEQHVVIGSNTTLFVPFVKANKIAGRVEVQRDEYSSEGAISLGDLRVSAVDTAGNTYSTLTDKRGGFVLFVPQSGRYKVSLKSVFSDNFVLEQNDFVVDFDGFKEFEIVFKYREKRRGININGGNGVIPNGSTFEDRRINGGTSEPQNDPSPSTSPPGSTPDNSPSPTTSPSGGTPDNNLSPSTSPSGSTPNTSSTIDMGNQPSEPLAPSDPGESPSQPGLVGSETTPESSGSSITWQQTQYYIVLGSYGSSADARQFFDNLNFKGNAMIVRTPQNTYEVIYGFRTEQEARQDLQRRNTIFPAAWVSRKL